MSFRDRASEFCADGEKAHSPMQKSGIWRGANRKALHCLHSSIMRARKTRALVD
jgi:hypothetical protein